MALLNAALLWSQKKFTPSRVMATATPVVYTDEASFLAAVNNNYYVENFDSYDWGTIQNQPSVLLASGAFTYTISTMGNLFSILSAMSTESTLMPITITNEGCSINYFGGYFIAVDNMGMPTNESIRVETGSYNNSNNNELSPSFIGFIFPSPVSSFALSNATGAYATAIDKLYVGYTPYINGVSTLSTPRNTPLTLTLSDITAISPKSETITLNVLAGTNYTVNGTTITPATDFTGTLDVPVSVSDATATSAVYTLHIDVTLPTAIDNNTTATEGFYPNPCQDGFTVAISSDASLLTISSLTGKVVLKQVVTNGTFVSVGELANGIYVVTLNGKSEKLVIKK